MNIKTIFLFFFALSTPLITQHCAAQIIDIQGKEAVSQALNKHMITVIKFHAEWCPACKSMIDTDTEIATQFTDQKNKKAFVFLQVDTDKKENKELAAQHQVKGLPTYRFFKGKTLEKTRVGTMSKEEFAAQIQDLMKK